MKKWVKISIACVVSVIAIVLLYIEINISNGMKLYKSGNYFDAYETFSKVSMFEEDMIYKCEYLVITDQFKNSYGEGAYYLKVSMYNDLENIGYFSSNEEAKEFRDIYFPNEIECIVNTDEDDMYSDLSDTKFDGTNFIYIHYSLINGWPDNPINTKFMIEFPDGKVDEGEAAQNLTVYDRSNHCISIGILDFDGREFDGPVKVHIYNSETNEELGYCQFNWKKEYIFKEQEEAFDNFIDNLFK